MSLTDDTHALIREHYQRHFKDKPNSLAVDATCGNGHDTAFLNDLGFTKVIGFDVQKIAIDSTRKYIGESPSIVLIHDSHTNLNEHIKQEVNCIMFNFGYLPSGDKAMTTQAKSSIEALQSGLTLLSDNGIMSLMCYPGHPAGAEETKAIRNWFNTLNTQQWCIETHLAASPKPTAPILYIIKRN